MITTFLTLTLLFLIFIWIVSWINYYNKLDNRLGNSIWRWSYDYPVLGKRDISVLDDKKFVILRRKKNQIITYMYLVVFLGFLVLMSFVSQILLIIQS
ncbi:hypothetical protein OA079_03260 [Candidatus Pelagibacter sp.]|mgnify:FL=1|nr:hypothetical protein [Candidatus Pelagibacter sp.]|tara:strand:+ start:18 stop:311 length:294 start_codon:yes stop_codon:yes gene_type:complete